MAFRCYICDRDLIEYRADLGRALWEDVPLWPPGGAALDGVIAADDLTHLSSASGNFKHVSVGEKVVPAGTLVNITGLGFFRVKSVTTNTKLEIENDLKRPSMSFAAVAASGYRFAVGGYSTHIQREYERLWAQCGMAKYVELSTNPLADGIELTNLVDMALYVPDNWHGADEVIILGALRRILFDAMRNNESSYRDIYIEVKELYEQALNLLQYQFDYDEDGAVDEAQSARQPRLIR